MRRWNWGKAALIAAGLVGAAQAQTPTPGDPAQVVVIRETGKPEQRCVIEYSVPQADGKTMHYVRDVATGERFRVLDGRVNKAASAPIVSKHWVRLNTPNDSGMAQALASSPARDAATRHTPTAAELARSAPKAGAPAPGPKPTMPPAKPLVMLPNADDGGSPVRAQLNQLSDAIPASQREAAATVLAISDARTLPEVVKALMGSARHDPAASVRTTCVRCLYRLSGEVPDVVAVIAQCRSDPDTEVAATAAKAMEEIGKRSK